MVADGWRYFIFDEQEKSINFIKEACASAEIAGALSVLSICVAQKFPHLQCQSFDFPKVVLLAQAHIAKAEFFHQIKAVTGDFFKEHLPKADVITVGMILHDWNLPNIKHLTKVAYDALPSGGALIAVENLIDDHAVPYGLSRR